MRALVLSGGSNRGAFELGCLRYLLKDLKLEYDILCGISIGAINSSVLGMYHKKQPEESYLALEDQWNKVTPSKVIKNWVPFGKLSGLCKQSLFNSSPLLEWLNNDLDLDRLRNNQRIVCVGAVSLTTAKYRKFMPHDENFVKGVAASSSFPGFFNPIEIDGELYNDGGLKKQVNLSDAIDLGADEIDMIVTAPPQDSNLHPNLKNAVDILGRTVSIMSNEILEFNIKICMYYNKLVENGLAPGKRYIKLNIIRPESNLIEDSMDFTQESIQRMFDIGYKISQETFKP